VDLDWVADYDRLRNELRLDRGYAITHVGQLTRNDGSSFAASRGVRFIESLALLFGFVRGAWAGPALLVGRDGTGSISWEHWSVRLTSPAEPRPSFFLDADPDMIRRMSPGFLAKVASDRWGEAFARAVQLYVAGNLGVPIEIGIMLAQAGLDVLAWSTFVRSGRVSATDFRKWSAGERFRRLLTPRRVPNSVPGPLAALAGPLPDVSLTADVFERIATVRNRIVHPPRGGGSLRRQPSDLITDSWRASLYFLELAILWLSGYQGDTYSRVENRRAPVPW
jgi:hypothetical protein